MSDEKLLKEMLIKEFGNSATEVRNQNTFEIEIECSSDTLEEDHEYTYGQLNRLEQYFDIESWETENGNIFAKLTMKNIKFNLIDSETN